MYKMDEKMSRILEKVGSELNNHKINWYLIGSAGLYLKEVPGINKIRDLDFLVSLNDYENIKNIFSDYSLKEKSSKFSKNLVFYINGIEVEFCAEDPQGIYMGGLDKDNSLFVNVGSLSVPLVPLEREEKCYRELGRNEKADLIKNHLNS